MDIDRKTEREGKGEKEKQCEQKQTAICCFMFHPGFIDGGKDVITKCFTLADIAS